jgi:phage tail-like protein
MADPFDKLNQVASVARTAQTVVETARKAESAYHRLKDRPYAGGRFTLELDERKSVGFVTSIDGGQFKAETVTSMVGSNHYVTKYAGKSKYEDITVSVGMAMSPAFWKWVEASLKQKPERRNGALVGYDFNSLERSRRTFKHALISEIGFPALDASSKATAQLTVKISPEILEYKKGDNSRLPPMGSPFEVVKQKMWLTSNFRFELERFKGDASLRNAKVEAFTVKQNIINNEIGHELTTRKEIGRLELPQLQVTFPEANLDKWMAWYKMAVVEGNRKDQYTTGSITYYASDGELTELMRVEFGGVSLVSLEIEKYEASKEGIARVKATLNTETMKLVAGLGNA